MSKFVAECRNAGVLTCLALQLICAGERGAGTNTAAKAAGGCSSPGATGHSVS
jgi:hypothetical protein